VTGRVTAALGAVYVLWGSTYLAIRVMVETIPPLLGAGVRFCLAGAGLAVALRVVRGAASLRIARSGLLAAALTGALILAGGIGLLTVAEQDVPSGAAAVVIATVPAWVVLLRAVTGDRPPLSTVAAVAGGLAGVSLVVGEALSGRAAGEAVVALIVAAALTGLGLFLSPRLPLPRDALVATAYEMLAGGAILLVAGLAFGELGELGASSRSIAALAYLVLFGSVAAYGAFVWLLQNASPSLVSTYAFVNPVVAVALGALVLDEALTSGFLLGSVLVIASAGVIWRDARSAA
jgi:drug/metabolite transporter (DMT)-like permease